MGDIPYYYGRSDCENGYPSGDVDFPFSNPKDVIFEFPVATLGWSHVSQFFQDRFDLSNRDIIGLIAGAHSIGNAHERISGFTTSWDVADDVFDNQFISVLYSEDPIAGIAFGVTQVYAQTTINPAQEGSLPQWSVEMSPFLISILNLDDPLIFDPPHTKLFLALNSDFSMVYDISYYIENGLELDIDCVSNAALFCDASEETILTAPRGFENSIFNKDKTSEQLGEQTECGENESCCEYIQCPIQCEGGMSRYQELIANVTRLLSDDNEFIEDEMMDCPAALGKRYSSHLNPDVRVPNTNLGNDFSQAFLKMITLGYVEPNGNNLLRIVGDE